MYFANHLKFGILNKWIFGNVSNFWILLKVLSFSAKLNVFCLSILPNWISKIEVSSKMSSWFIKNSIEFCEYRLCLYSPWNFTGKFKLSQTKSAFPLKHIGMCFIYSIIIERTNAITLNEIMCTLLGWIGHMANKHKCQLDRICNRKCIFIYERF